MSKRSWMRVIDDFGGHDKYLEHAAKLPVDANGEVVETTGDLKELMMFHFGKNYAPSSTLTEKQLRQLVIFLLR
jgi:hypothetical protein